MSLGIRGNDADIGDVLRFRLGDGWIEAFSSTAPVLYCFKDASRSGLRTGKGALPSSGAETPTSNMELERLRIVLLEGPTRNKLPCGMWMLLLLLLLPPMLPAPPLLAAFPLSPICRSGRCLCAEEDIAECAPRGTGPSPLDQGCWRRWR